MLCNILFLFYFTLLKGCMLFDFFFFFVLWHNIELFLFTAPKYDQRAQGWWQCGGRFQQVQHLEGEWFPYILDICLVSLWFKCLMKCLSNDVNFVKCWYRFRRWWTRSWGSDTLTGRRRLQTRTTTTTTSACSFTVLLQLTVTRWINAIWESSGYKRTFFFPISDSKAAFKQCNPSFPVFT